MTITPETLPGGIRFCTEPMPQMETVAIAISVDVGARWEREEQHGISHLLEHMAFKGTNRYSALQIAEIFDSIGGHFNAFTSHEHTVYYAKVLAEHWQTAADILCDIVQHSLYDEEELKREKGVILQELAMHHDTPDDVVFDLFQQAAFGTGALGRSILGSEESIQAHPRGALVAFVEQHYQPERIAVTAAGAIETSALRELIATKLNLATRGQASTLEPARYVGGECITPKAELEQLQLVLGLPGLPLHHGDHHAQLLLCNLFGSGMSSRLFQEVREKRGLVYTIQSFTASYAECGTFGIYAATGEKQAGELMKIVCDELHRLKDTISEEELHRAKQQLIANIRMGRESTSNLAEWIGRHLLHYGEYRTADDLQQSIERVSLADVSRLAAGLVGQPCLSLAALGPTRQLLSGEQISERLAA